MKDKKPPDNIIVPDTGMLLTSDELRKKVSELTSLNAELELKIKNQTEAILKTLEEKNNILESIGDAFFALDKLDSDILEQVGRGEFGR